MNSLYISSLGMMNQQMNVDIISNNLANINTAGFKKSEINFKDLYWYGPPGQEALASFVGIGSTVDGITKIHTQGMFAESQNPLDLAIEGDGFFSVLLPDGATGYTRDGSFRLDGEGHIVTSQGYRLQPPINIDQSYSQLIIDNEGRVSIMPIDSEENIEIGMIELTRFANPAGLENISGNIYLETESSGGALAGGAAGKIRQGYKEMANVNVIEEMVNLISAQRAYEINSKAVRTTDEMLQIRNNLR
jgi:flagellar basal-body rod protein FlgG